MKQQPHDYTKHLLVKLQTKGKPPVAYQPSYAPKHSYNQGNPTQTRLLTGKPSFSQKSNPSVRQLSRQVHLRNQTSVMSGSSSSSQLLRTDMTRKVVLEYQELQVKYATLEEEHTKLKKKNEKLSANYKALRERYDHVISRRGGDKHNDMMNVSTEENQTSEHRGTQLCDLSQIPNLDNFSSDSKTILPVSLPPHTQRPSKQCQTAENWRLQVALRDKQRLQNDNNFLRKQLQSIRQRMDTYLLTNNHYSTQLESVNAELKGQLSSLQEQYARDMAKLDKIRELVVEDFSGQQRG